MHVHVYPDIYIIYVGFSSMTLPILIGEAFAFPNADFYENLLATGETWVGHVVSL